MDLITTHFQDADIQCYWQALTGSIALAVEFYLLIPLSYVMVSLKCPHAFLNLIKDLTLEKVL